VEETALQFSAEDDAVGECYVCQCEEEKRHRCQAEAGLQISAEVDGVSECAI
jgi:hypothetical protein